MFVASFFFRVPSEGWRPDRKREALSRRGGPGAVTALGTCNRPPVPDYSAAPSDSQRRRLRKRGPQDSPVLSAMDNSLLQRNHRHRDHQRGQDDDDGHIRLHAAPHRDTAFTASYVLMISVFNIGGRLFWATISDYLGRKNTYYCFFALGALTLHSRRGRR